MQSSSQASKSAGYLKVQKARLQMFVRKQIKHALVLYMYSARKHTILSKHKSTLPIDLLKDLLTSFTQTVTEAHAKGLGVNCQVK